LGSSPRVSYPPRLHAGVRDRDPVGGWAQSEAHVSEAALLADSRASLLRAINAHMRLISIIGGLVLLLFGVLLLTDNFA
jgi:hypothetical protein